MSNVQSVLSMCLLALAGLSCGLFAEEIPEDELVTIEHDDRNRVATLHYPQRVKTDKQKPLLIAFHGAGDSGANFAKGSGLNSLADQYGFIVAYPNATGVNWAEGCNCIRPDLDGVDDVGYIEALVDHLARVGHVDTTRVFGVGYSQGGIFSHHLACEKADVFKGMASFAGPISRTVSNSCEPAVPIKIYVAHGTADTVLPFEGVSNGISSLLSARKTMNFWREKNGCRDSTDPRAVDIGIERVTYTDALQCHKGAVVQFVEWLNGTHRWPEKEIRIGQQLVTFFRLDK